MHFEQKELIRKNLVILVNTTTNIQGVCTYLRSVGEMTACTEEDCMSKPTSSGKNSYFYSIITKRSPDAFKHLLDALDSTGNVHVANVLRVEQKVEEQPKTTGMFGDLIDAVGSLRPVEVKSERSNMPVYKVSVNLYTNAQPRSAVGLNDLPYVMALMQGITKESVQSWKNCPSCLALDFAFEVYKKEIESAKSFLECLDNCSIDISSNQYPTTALNVLRTNPSVLLYNYVSKSFGESEKNLLAIKIHLCTYNSMSMAIRKICAPKPSAYLLFNANERSPAVLSRDKDIVSSFLAEDETCHLEPHPGYTPCPF